MNNLFFSKLAWIICWAHGKRSQSMTVSVCLISFVNLSLGLTLKCVEISRKLIYYTYVFNSQWIVWIIFVKLAVKPSCLLTGSISHHNQCVSTCSVCRSSALIGGPRRRPTSFSAQLACDWTAESLLMSLHAEKHSDGTARTSGKWSVYCTWTLDLLPPKDYNSHEKSKRGRVVRVAEKKFIDMEQRRIQPVSYRYDWGNVSIFVLFKV